MTHRFKPTLSLIQIASWFLLNSMAYATAPTCNDLFIKSFEYPTNQLASREYFDFRSQKTWLERMRLQQAKWTNLTTNPRRHQSDSFKYFVTSLVSSSQIESILRNQPIGNDGGLVRITASLSIIDEVHTNTFHEQGFILAVDPSLIIAASDFDMHMHHPTFRPDDIDATAVETYLNEVGKIGLPDPHQILRNSNSDFRSVRLGHNEISVFRGNTSERHLEIEGLFFKSDTLGRPLDDSGFNHLKLISEKYRLSLIPIGPGTQHYVISARIPTDGNLKDKKIYLDCSKQEYDDLLRLSRHQGRPLYIRSIWMSHNHPEPQRKFFYGFGFRNGILSETNIEYGFALGKIDFNNPPQKFIDLDWIPEISETSPVGRATSPPSTLYKIEFLKE